MPTSLSPAPSSAKAAKQKTGCMTKTDFSPMKKIFALAGLVTAAVISLTNCQPKELGTDVPAAGKTVLIKASMDADTKTTADGMSTLWAEGDKINLFYGSSYTSLGEVTIADGVGTKQATFQVTDAPSGSVKWYAIYPYSSKLETPAEQTASFTYIGDTRGLNQDGWDNTGALCGTVCPLYGIAEGTAEEVNLPMKHLASAIELNITNNTGSEIIVNSVTVTASEDIIGSYYIAFASGTPDFVPRGDNYVKNAATVNIEDSTLSNGESGKAYLAVKPYTQSESEAFKVTVNATVGGKAKTAEFELHPTGAQCVFTAGIMKQVNVSITSFDDVETSTVADALAEDGEYTIEGATVTMVYAKGVFVKDNTGTICVYLNATPEVEKGDVVTVNGKSQVRYNMRQFTAGTTLEKTGTGSTPSATSWDGSNVTAAFNPSNGNNAAYVKITAKANTTKEFAVDGSSVVLYASNQSAGVSITAGKTYDLIGYAYDWTTYGSGDSAKDEVIFYIESAEESNSVKTVTFDFKEGLDEMGLDAPESGAGIDFTAPVIIDGVTLTPSLGDHNQYPPRIWNASGTTELRAYKGNTIVISAPSGYNITGLTGVPNAFESTLAEGAKCAVVTLSHTASGTAKASAITVSLENSSVVAGISGARTRVSAAESNGNTVSVVLGGYSSAPSLTATVDGTVVKSASIASRTASEATISFAVNSNPGTEERTGTITVKSGSTTGIITVTQNGVKFTVSKEEVYLDAKAGSTSTLTAHSDQNWSVSISGSGFSVSPDTFDYDGENDSATLTVTANETNTSSAQKTLGSFVISRVDGISKTVTVYQKSSKLETPKLTVVADGASKTISASWDPVSGAVGYKYKLSTQSSYTETTDTEVQFTNISLGTYTVSVIAVGDNDPYTDSDEASETVTLASTTVSTLTLSSSNKFAIESPSNLNDDHGNTWTATSISGSIINTYNSANYSGQQFGTGSAAWTGTFTATIPGTVTKVAIKANTGDKATLSVKVGSTSFKCGGSTSVAVNKHSDQTIETYEFTGSATGKITITVSDTNKAFYLGEIAVTSK